MLLIDEISVDVIEKAVFEFSEEFIAKIKT